MTAAIEIILTIAHSWSPRRLTMKSELFGSDLVAFLKILAHLGLSLMPSRSAAYGLIAQSRI
jgi:hypothetical protein